MTTRIFIATAGEATRWANHLGTPKHFVQLPTTVDGKSLDNLLSINLNNLREVFTTQEINVIAREVDVEDFNSPFSSLKFSEAKPNLLKATLSPENGDADKVATSFMYMNPEDTNIILWGDVFLTKKTIEVFYNLSQEQLLDGWLCVQRFGRNEFSGSVGSEIFGFIIQPKAWNLFNKELMRIIKLYQEGKISRNGGHELYRAMSGLNDEDILRWWPNGGGSYDNQNWGHSADIHDGTEDFDLPYDYHAWLASFYGGNKDHRKIMLEGTSDDKILIERGKNANV